MRVQTCTGVDYCEGTRCILSTPDYSGEAGEPLPLQGDGGEEANRGQGHSSALSVLLCLLIIRTRTPSKRLPIPVERLPSSGRAGLQRLRAAAALSDAIMSTVGCQLGLSQHFWLKQDKLPAGGSSTVAVVAMIFIAVETPQNIWVVLVKSVRCDGPGPSGVKSVAPRSPPRRPCKPAGFVLCGCGCTGRLVDQ